MVNETFNGEWNPTHAINSRSQNFNLNGIDYIVRIKDNPGMDRYIDKVILNL